MIIIIILIIIMIMPIGIPWADLVAGCTIASYADTTCYRGRRLPLFVEVLNTLPSSVTFHCRVRNTTKCFTLASKVWWWATHFIDEPRNWMKLVGSMTFKVFVDFFLQLFLMQSLRPHALLLLPFLEPCLT